MRYILAAIFALTLACDIPSKEDLSMTIDECRSIVEDAIPPIVQQITIAVLAACSELQTSITDAPNVITNDVLTQLGCVKIEGGWSCSQSIICLPNQ